VYYYKFIVDGEWKFSPDDPTAPDEHGNINNVVDTTNIESVNRMMVSSTDMRKPGSSDVRANENPFTEEAPVLPPHLMGIYFLNEKDKKTEEQYNLTEEFNELDLEDGIFFCEFLFLRKKEKES
jgi:5'-AMP-activated protein kinase regulatory beta subunit